MRSIVTGPFEPNLLTFRATLGLENWTALSTGEKKLVADQVRAAALLQPAWLRRAINDPLRQRLVLEILAAEPQLYARFRGDGDLRSPPGVVLDLTQSGAQKQQPGHGDRRDLKPEVEKRMHRDQD
jgi:hypothetical protein